MLILILWALVALLGMVWNSGEYTTRRQHVQNAADAAAHAASMWMGRTTNLISATNMTMCQNGCAEVIWRAVGPTHDQVQARLDSETRRTEQLYWGNTSGQPERNIPDTEYFDELLGNDGWAGEGRGRALRDRLNNQLTPKINQALPLALPYIQGQSAAQLQQQIQTAIQVNDSTLQSIVSLWTDVVGPSVNQWIAEVKWRLREILATIPSEEDQLAQFDTQAQPAQEGITPDDLLAKRQEMFTYETEIKERTAPAIDEQREKLADFYKVKVTYATPRNTEYTAEPAIVTAPVHEAEIPVGEIHQDSIRPMFPEAAIRRFGTDEADVWIDPINVNVDNSSIWHPGLTEPVMEVVELGGQTFSGDFHVHGGEWGQLLCAPLLRYFNERLWRDEQGLRQWMQNIDRIRADLQTRIAGIGVPPVIPDPPAPPQQIPLLPVPPPSAPAADRQLVIDTNNDIRQFNQDVLRYIQDLSTVWNDLDRLDYIVRRAPAGGATSIEVDGTATYQGYGWFQAVGLAFADQTWRNQVEHFRRLVLYQMGQDKQFMILKPYQLRPIPEWAKPGMRQSAYNYIHQWIYSRNVGPVTRTIYQRMYRWALQIYIGQGVPQPVAAQMAYTFGVTNAPVLGQELVTRVANEIAPVVAEEWVSRPWPYEIKPPADGSENSRGLQEEDRFNFFTVLAAAQVTEETDVRPLLTTLFRGENRPMTAYAQAEAFNWMEFNAPYGASDHYEQVTHWGHDVYGGSPRSWRISSIGGWNWNPRLAFSDALGPAIETNMEFEQFFEDGGVTGYDADAVKTITLH